MSGKAKSDVKALKGKEAEDKVLEYLKRMNRPYGAVDVSANLKGAVPKSATQKILLGLAEKGELVMKTYGKTTLFVANQANIESMSPDKIAALEAECKSIDEENKVHAADVKALTNELAKLKTSLTDAELSAQIELTRVAIEEMIKRLTPLRAGTPLISAQDLDTLDAEWVKWRGEWVRRKKVFTAFWQLATDSLPPQDSAILAEDLGIELDGAEHTALERSPLCSVSLRPSSKRKR